MTAKLQQFRANSCELTTFVESCNDRQMQRPRSDKLDTAQSLQNVREIWHRFMAVAVFSAFRKSLTYGVENNKRDRLPSGRGNRVQDRGQRPNRHLNWLNFLRADRNAISIRAIENQRLGIANHHESTPLLLAV